MAAKLRLAFLLGLLLVGYPTINGSVDALPEGGTTRAAFRNSGENNAPAIQDNLPLSETRCTCTYYKCGKMTGSIIIMSNPYPITIGPALPSNSDSGCANTCSE